MCCPGPLPEHRWTGGGLGPRTVRRRTIHGGRAFRVAGGQGRERATGKLLCPIVSNAAPLRGARGRACGEVRGPAPAWEASPALPIGGPDPPLPPDRVQALARGRRGALSCSPRPMLPAPPPAHRLTVRPVDQRARPGTLATGERRERYPSSSPARASGAGRTYAAPYRSGNASRTAPRARAGRPIRFSACP